MDRSPSHYGYRIALLLLLAVVVATEGCTGLLTTVLYLSGAGDAKAEFTGLREKKVVVVCRPVVGEQFHSWGVAQEISKQVGVLLKNNIKKVDVVDYRKVAEWVDENTWEEYTEIGNALEADIVVGIDLENFSVLLDQTLYQGKANISLKVFDCPTDELSYEKILPQIVYPPNTGIPTQEMQEAQFRRAFVSTVATQVARHFYSHDPRVDFAPDAAAF